MEEWFVEAPSEKENEESDTVWTLRGGKSMPDLMVQTAWVDFFAFLDDCESPVLLLTDNSDCCLTAANVDPLEEYEYHLDLIIVVQQASEEPETCTTPTSYKVRISGAEASSTAVTLAGLLRWISSSSSSSAAAAAVPKGLDVTLKAFATQPRQALPRLLENCWPIVDSEKESVSVLSNNNNNNIQWLRLHFCAVEQGGLGLRMLMQGIPNVEFVQCTVDGWDDVLVTTTTQLQTLTVSCNMPEFAKLADSIGNSGSNCTITQLNLLLHFWLQGPPLEAFCRAVKDNKLSTLTKLTIRYLDVSDAGWMLLTQSLHQHPTLQSLSLTFTDNFVDNYRRLTPERRTERTQAVLDLVRACTSLREVTWPAFQKDESLVPDIEAALEASRAKA
jgi:hypothetical protein